jgi:hypothetical protein
MLLGRFAKSYLLHSHLVSPLLYRAKPLIFKKRRFIKHQYFHVRCRSQKPKWKPFNHLKSKYSNQKTCSRKRKHTVLSFESNLKVESERTKKETIHKKKKKMHATQNVCSSQNVLWPKLLGAWLLVPFANHSKGQAFSNACCSLRHKSNSFV